MKQLEKSVRAFELDALRGLALFMMILHHFIFDLRYLLEIDVFAFQETGWFEHFLQPLFLNVFIIVSGICCTFSRNNTKRGLRLFAFAAGLTAASCLISFFSKTDMYIFFNILHLLAVGMLLYAALTRPERIANRRLVRTDVLLLLLLSVLIWLSSLLHLWTGSRSFWLIPFGLLPDNVPGMADYLPLIPWLGFFLLGAVIGRHAYAQKRTAFPNTPAWISRVTLPFEFLGRHSLLIYILHQPVLLLILYGLRGLGVL